MEEWCIRRKLDSSEQSICATCQADMFRDRGVSSDESYKLVKLMNDYPYGIALTERKE